MGEVVRYSAAMLRRELSARGQALAKAEALLHEVSPGSNPVVMFGRDQAGRHGNFHAVLPRELQEFLDVKYGIVAE
jgi:hypothetical protein